MTTDTSITGITHISLSIGDLERSLVFHQGILGLPYLVEPFEVWSRRAHPGSSAGLVTCGGGTCGVDPTTAACEQLVAGRLRSAHVLGVGLLYLYGVEKSSRRGDEPGERSGPSDVGGSPP